MVTINGHQLSTYYANEIAKFFQGQGYFEDRARGHVWVAEHDGYDTLTVEPLQPLGGQYEIAVRIAVSKAKGMQWQGYIASDGYFTGVLTDGH